MSWRRNTTTLLLAGLLAACAGGGERWAGSVSDSAGVAMVSNPAEGVWGAGEGWTLEEELRIGAMEGDPDYQFGQVGGIAVGSDGRIYVLDSQAQRIQVYSPDGDYMMTIGGPGGGPGELGQMGGGGGSAVLMGPGDTLLAVDMANQRMNRYAADGSSLGSFRVSMEDGLPVAFRSTPSGLIAKQVRPFALPGQPQIENPTDAILRLTAGGEVVDTLMRFPSGGTFKFGGGGMPEFDFFAPEPIWALLDDGRLLFGINDRYRLSVYSPDAELERVVMREYERLPVGQADQDAIVGFMERQWERFGVPAQVLSQLRKGIQFEEFFPAFASIWPGPAGTIWVQHVLPPSQLGEEALADYNPQVDAGSPEWDVFDAEGRYLGVVTMPERFTPHQLHGENIYGVWRDELDVQYVVRMGLLRSAEEEATTD